MGIEKWIAVTSLALFFMFIGEMISIYLFMTEVPEEFEFMEFEANPKILQFISIGVAPAGILAGLAYLMSRRYGSKTIGYLIIFGGIVLAAGMAYCYTIVEKIEEQYITEAVIYTPVLFMGLSIPVIIVGASLLKIKKRRPKKEYF
jgi:activator of 2-hydroxyglutaryl-CoA dehydratase